MNSTEPSYKDKCRNFFVERYEPRIKRLTPYPIPLNATRSVHYLLPYLLSDKEFYQARIYASSTPGSTLGFDIGALLWEALGMIPADFMVLCDALVNPKGSFWRTYSHHTIDMKDSYPPYPSLRDLASSLTTWPVEDRDICFHNIWLTLHNYHTMLHRGGFGKFWSLRPPRCNGLYPLEYGLMIYMEDQWNDLAWVYLDNALSAMPDLPESKRTNSAFIHSLQNDKIYDSDEEQETARALHVLFSAAGTGKTRQIFELLQKHWGFYMLAPNLKPMQAPPADQHDQESIDIIDPQRYSVSRDTYTMFEDYPQIDPGWVSDKTKAFRAIIVARVALLYEFLHHPAATPTKWLWLQISCDTFDPFDALYRLFRLSSPEYLQFETATSIHAEIPGYLVPKCYALLEDLSPDGSKAPLYHCFDEAQLTIDTPQASAMFYDLYETLTLFYVLTYDSVSMLGPRSCVHMRDGTDPMCGESHFVGLDNAWRVARDFPDINPALVVSGTSLQLEVLREMLAKFSSDIWGVDEPTAVKWNEYLVHHIFPLVASDQDFWTLYEEHLTGIISEGEMTHKSGDENSTLNLPLLSRNGRPLALQQSSHEVDLNELRKLLWRPLHITSLPHILKLLSQTYLSIMRQDRGASRGRESFLSTNVETLLDHQNSEEVVSAFAYHIVEPLCRDRASPLEPFGESLFRLLTGYGILEADQVSTIIRDEVGSSSGSDVLFHETAKTIHNALRNVYIRNLITSHSMGQRGRYRWSTIYIEEIMLQSRSLALRDPSLREIRSLVEQAKNKTNNAAVEALKTQIRKMKASGKMELVQDLFRAGIRAEMMSTPTIFLKQSHAQLVTYGFALVQEDGETIRYTLAEPIAVHAVMDYLRTEGGKDYQELMLQWLIHTQDDYEVRSMFGKATEWFVAMSFDRMFRCQSSSGSDIPDLLDGSARREVLLRLLAESVLLDSRTDRFLNLKSMIQLNDFALSESPTILKYQTPGTIWSWMRQCRIEGRISTPTFMFPDINAGPDLIFVLEDQATTLHSDGQHGSRQMLFENTKKVFVAVQIKTGRGARFEDAMETLLDSNWHKNMDKHARDAEVAELEHWQGTPFLLLLNCTGITVKQDKIRRWMKKNSGRIAQGHFVCVLDETVTSDIWGQDFVVLADAIKRQNAQKDAREQDVNNNNQKRTDRVISGTQLTDRSKKRARGD
ncbi:hypothetical protein FSARC_8805 [Fusarium sarcochroum]|uniref:Uncharacterized protein n=1 Tax=Fusarium sarcochroum TaxID=1208366 RepID=A0A8H4X5X6_9HYPO|nr:hypothetical protein FSARC_8805 [Fusarium sarcochroum]